MKYINVLQRVLTNALKDSITCFTSFLDQCLILKKSQFICGSPFVSVCSVLEFEFHNSPTVLSLVIL